MILRAESAKNGKINIFTDGGFRFAVSGVLWASSGYANGEDVTEEQLESLMNESLLAAAYDKALSYLGTRMHAERELFMKLRRSFPAAVCEKAIAKCAENGFVNDEEYASAFAEELFRRKKYAPARIRAELLKRGVDKNTAENAVLALDIDRDSGIMEILSKMNISEESGEKDKQRAYRRLLSAGYSHSEIADHLKV